MFSGTSGPTRDILYKSELVDILGKENLFLRSHEAEDYYDGIYNKTSGSTVNLEGKTPIVTSFP